MRKLFTKILVPVNFNRNTNWSLDKAVQLANKFDCDILLLHVYQPLSTFSFLHHGIFSGSSTWLCEDEVAIKMKELEMQHKANLKEGLIMSSVIQAGYWQTVMKDVIIAEHIDLTLIPRSRKKLASSVIRRININKLSQQTGCPIMTVTRNLKADTMQNIVVPVFDLLPVKKLTMATYLSLETSGCIYLMGRDKPAREGDDKRYLMRAYQLLSEFGKLNIQCALQGNEDEGGSTLAYAKNVNANLIVVNPGKESRLKGLWNKLRGKYLCSESDIPVLTVGA
jgi:hypothetical protein